MSSTDPAVDLNGILRSLEGQAAEVNNVTQTVLDFKIETRCHYQEIQERMVKAVDQSKQEIIQAVFSKLEEVVDAVGLVKNELHAMKSTMQSKIQQPEGVTTVTTEQVDNTTQTEQSQIQQPEGVTTVTTEQVNNTTQPEQSQIQQPEGVTTVTTEQVDNTTQTEQSQIQQPEGVTTVTTEQVDNTTQTEQSQIQQPEGVTTVTTEQVNNTTQPEQSQIQQPEGVTTVTTGQVDNTTQTEQSQIQQPEGVTTVTTEQVDSRTQTEQSQIQQPAGVTTLWGVARKNPEETGGEDIIPWQDLHPGDPKAPRMLAFAVRKKMLEKSEASQTNSVTIVEETFKDMRFVRREYQGFYLYEMVEPLPGEHHLQVEFISSAITLTCKWLPLRLTRVPLSTLTVDQVVKVVDEHISFLLGNSVRDMCSGVTAKICHEGKDLSELRTSSLRALGLQGRRIGFREQPRKADFQCYLQCTI